MKYQRRKKYLEQRRAEFDDLSTDQRQGRKRPGSLNAGGPKSKRRR
jgi:hypothetical protein